MIRGGPTNTDRQQNRTRINGDISAREIRVVGPNGELIGIITPDKALRMAEELELDLVEIAPQAQPPVCKIMDYGKFKYEQQKKERLLKKKQQVILVKEVRFHPNIDTHDFDFKVKHARQFLLDGNKVKASVVFRGRQLAHQEFGVELLRKFREALDDVGLLEKEPSLEGRSLVSIFAPDKKKIAAMTKKSSPAEEETEE